MDDRTRADSFPADAGEAFSELVPTCAAYVGEWPDGLDASSDALAILRHQHESMTDSSLSTDLDAGDTHLGTHEVAEFLGVKPRTVSQWRSRRRLPEPDLVLNATNLWRRSTILRWAGDTGRLSSTALRAEYERLWKVAAVPYRKGGPIPDPRPVRPVAGMRPNDGAAEAFATYVREWLDEFAPLVDALVILRQQHELMACSFLLSVTPLALFRESWEPWGLSAGDEAVRMADRLVPFLGSRQAHRLRYALWGECPTGGTPG